MEDGMSDGSESDDDESNELVIRHSYTYFEMSLATIWLQNKYESKPVYVTNGLSPVLHLAEKNI